MKMTHPLSRSRHGMPGGTLLTTLIALCLCASTTVHADYPKNLNGLVAAATDLAAGAEVTAVDETPWGGVYVVTLSDGRLVHGDREGKFLMFGDLLERVDDGGVTNHTENARAARRMLLFASDEMSGALTYPATVEQRGHLVVFTDPTCTFCQKFHQELPLLNALGVRVDYLAFPRGGAGTPAASSLAAAWCSEDPQGSLDALKAGLTPPGDGGSGSCDEVVSMHHDLGRSIGVHGTPGVFNAATGQQLGGHIGIAALASALALVGE